MNASRILPTVAFSVAVSFFFVPPVIAVVKNAPAAAKASAPAASLIVASTPVAMTPVRAKAQQDGVCAPTSATTSAPEQDASAKGAKRSPWNPWVVASLEAH